MRGLFVEVASLIALVAGVYGAIYFSGYAAELLEKNLDWSEQYITVAAFAITFIVIVLLISLAGKAFTKLADFAALGIINKILGAVFGFLKVALILSIIIMVLNNMDESLPNISEETKEESVIYPHIQPIAPAIFPALINAAEELDEEIREEIEENQNNR